MGYADLVTRTRIIDTVSFSFFFLLPPSCSSSSSSFFFFPGPQHSSATYHDMYMCIAPHARRHMWDPTFDLIDQTACNRVGRVLERESTQRMQLYPLGNVIFYTQIPYIKSHVMSRLFQYMVADLGFQFTSSEYPERLMRKYTQVSFPDTQHVIWVLRKGPISIR